MIFAKKKINLKRLKNVALLQLSLYLAFLLRFNFDIPKHILSSFYIIFLLNFLIKYCQVMISGTAQPFKLFHLNSPFIRVILLGILSPVFFLVINMITYHDTGVYLIPNSVIIIDYMIVVNSVILNELLFQRFVTLKYNQMKRYNSLPSTIVAFFEFIKNELYPSKSQDKILQDLLN